MSGFTPTYGDIYWVYRNVTSNSAAFGQKASRPCVCVDPTPIGTWAAIPRSSTDARQPSVPSPAKSHPGLNKEGHWLLRFKHAVLKDKTGTAACMYLLTIAETEEMRAIEELHADRYGTAQPTDPATKL